MLPGDYKPVGRRERRNEGKHSQLLGSMIAQNLSKNSSQ